MKLYIKQKVFSWGDKFTVKNGNGVDCYNIRGDVFSFTHRLHIYDMSGVEVATLHKKVFAFAPKYFIEIGGRTLTIVRELFTFRPRFYFKEYDYRIEGDFFAHQYDMTSHGGNNLVFAVDKHWFTWGDSYEIDVPNPSDALLSLATLIAIDAINADASNNNG